MKFLLSAMILFLSCPIQAGTYFNVPASSTDITTMSVSGKIGVAASTNTNTTYTIWLDGVNGNVGIGSASAPNRLYINTPYSDSTESVIKAIHRSAFNKVGAAIEIGSLSSVSKIIGYNYPFDNQSSQLAIQTQDNGGVTHIGFYQNGSGYVGIGTTAPTTELDVNGTVTAAQFVGGGSGINGIGVLAATQTFTGANTFSSTVTFSNVKSTTAFAGWIDIGLETIYTIGTTSTTSTCTLGKTPLSCNAYYHIGTLVTYWGTTPITGGCAAYCDTCTAGQLQLYAICARVKP